MKTQTNCKPTSIELFANSGKSGLVANFNSNKVNLPGMLLSIIASTIIFLLIVVMHIPVFGQDYHTIRVNGTIILVEKNSELQRGMTFDERDSLVFKTYNSLATVVHPEKGRFILRPDNVDLAYAKASYSPALSNIQSRSIHEGFSEEYDNIDLSKAKASFTPAVSNVSSRNSSLITLNDIQNHFHGEYAIIDDIMLYINPEKFPMTTDKFFFIRYVYNSEPVFKMLKSTNDSLLINKTELITVDGIVIENPEVIKEMEIWYMERDNNNEITFMGTFEPVFIDETQLYEEISVILDVFKDKPKDEIIAEILSYINDFYAKPNRDSVEMWLSNITNF